MHYTTKIVKNIVDENLHNSLVKFGKGEFDGPKVYVKVYGKDVILKSSLSYEGILGKAFILCLDEQKLEVSGKIVFLKKPDEKVSKEYGIELKFKGNRYEGSISCEMERDEAYRLYEELHEWCYMLLNLKVKDYKRYKLTTKKRLPNVKNMFDVEFCSCRTKKENRVIDFILEEIIPDFKKEFKESYDGEIEFILSNGFLVRELILPEDYKRIPPKELRLKALRRGTLVRTLSIKGIGDFVKKWDFNA
ncbi:MAG: hypothetical protein ACTSR0_06650 [Candidatus Asgardarchaeia archaeon]